MGRGGGWGQGAQHSASLQSWFAHIPGLRILCVVPTELDQVHQQILTYFDTFWLNLAQWVKDALKIEEGKAFDGYFWNTTRRDIVFYEWEKDAKGTLQKLPRQAASRARTPCASRRLP